MRKQVGADSESLFVWFLLAGKWSVRKGPELIFSNLPNSAIFLFREIICGGMLMSLFPAFGLLGNS